MVEADYFKPSNVKRVFFIAYLRRVFLERDWPVRRLDSCLEVTTSSAHDQHALTDRALLHAPYTVHMLDRFLPHTDDDFVQRPH